MRIVSWNMPRTNLQAWEYLLELDPDIALLQEIRTIPEYITSKYHLAEKRPISKKDSPQNFSTVILARGEMTKPIRLHSKWDWVNREIERFEGNMLAHEVELNERINVVSVYSPHWPVNTKHLKDVDVTEIKLEANPNVWMTEILWAALQQENIKEEKWIIGGDFNTSPTFDETWGNGNQEVLDRMQSLELTECLRHSNGELVPTFRNPREGKVIHQMDHLFVSPGLAKKLKKCITGDRARVFESGLSDHLPIICDIED